MSEIPELTDAQLRRAIPARLRKRLMQGRFESGEDIAALRGFIGLTQADFATAIGISIHTLRNWEQGRRKPTWETVLALAEALGVDCTAFTAQPGPEAEAPRPRGRPRKVLDVGAGESADVGAKRPRGRPRRK